VSSVATHSGALAALCRKARRRCTSALLVGLLVAAPSAHAAVITVVNNDGPGEGFNDPTTVAPIGGNTGTTRGQQRLIAFQYAADIWGSLLNSPVETRMSARFDPLDCNGTSALLGLAGPKAFFSDFVGAPRSATWYPVALANKLAGTDVDPSNDDIDATFNSTLDTTCPFPRDWYYGLDGNPPASGVDFVTVVLHELGHGLGFLTLIDLSTGAKANGLNDAYMLYLEDHSTGTRYPDMSDLERVTASIDTGDLHWVGANVVAGSGGLTSGRHPSGHVEMYAPNPSIAASSLSHFSNAISPNELMEPSYTGPMKTVGLAAQLLQDIGWGPVGEQVSPTFTRSPTPTWTQQSTATVTSSASATVAPTVTPTSTLTSLASATSSPTPEGGTNNLAGRISYYSADRPVAGARVTLVGPVVPATTTDATGSYAFPNLATARWEIQPAKTGDVSSAVSPFDAAYVLQVIVGKRTFDGSQTLACDVSGDGSLSALDAARILQFTVGKIARFPVAEACASDWAFVPIPETTPGQAIVQPQMSPGTCRAGSIVFDPLSGQVAGQNFLGILFGDCTGNWEPSAGGGMAEP
jgi:hypothetical protein